MPDHAPLKVKSARLPRVLMARLPRLVLGGALTLALVLTLLAGAALMMSGRALTLPVWAVADLEARLNRALEGQARLSLEGVSVRMLEGLRPELRLDDLRLAPAEGAGFAILPEATVRFDPRALLLGQIRPEHLRLSGARLAVRRLEDGSFDLDIGGGGASPPASLAELLERIADVYSLPLAASLERAEADAVSLTLDDRRSGRVYHVGDGRMSLSRDGERVLLNVGMGLTGAEGQTARAQLHFVMGHEGMAALNVRVEGMAAADLAAQAPALAPLRALAAPLSGEMRAGLAADGRLSYLDGTLSVGAGALQPVPGVQPVAVDGAEFDFVLEPSAARLRIPRLVVDSPALRLRASGHVDLHNPRDGIPQDFVTQLAFSDLQINPEGVFEQSVRFASGMADVRLRLDPFSVDVGQFSLSEAGGQLQMRGQVRATDLGWDLAVDLTQDQIRHDQLLALWPVQLVPKTREWLARNVQQGLLYGVKAGVRLRPGQEPRLGLGYEFRDGDVRFMPTLPPIRQGRGYAVIEGMSYTTVVEDGIVSPPEGGDIRVSRSMLRIPDFRHRPAVAEIHLNTQSTLSAALSLLDQPPFGFLSRAGMPTNLGEGRAELRTRLRLPLQQHVPREAVEFDVAGTLSDLSSERLMPGRRLRADRLSLSADPAGISLEGPVRIGEAQAEVRWHQPLERAGTPGQITGRTRLDRAFAKEFLAAFGGDLMQGPGAGVSFTLDLPRGQPPQLTLRSDLRGTGLALPQLGWRKEAQSAGKLELSGQITTPLKFDRLHLSAPGLTLGGKLALTRSGALERLELSDLDIGDWLSGSALIEGQGAGQRLALTGGHFDLRHLPDALAGAATGGAAGAGEQLEIALDEARLTGDLRLTRLRGTLRRAGGGVNGRLNALLNGEVPVTLDLSPGPRGTALRLRAADGGALLRATGLFSKAHGGAISVALVPGGGAGNYQGQVEMEGFVVRDLPALAELLSAVSIVGLIDQLNSYGVAFSQASGQFRLTPQGIELTEMSAVGPSFGVSLEGVYYTGADRLNLRGVISPFYMINAIGSVLTRPGEGLVGFTYRIQGSAGRPEVSVNPLSALAPGFLRDMLRRPAARLAP